MVGHPRQSIISLAKTFEILAFDITSILLKCWLSKKPSGVRTIFSTTTSAAILSFRTLLMIPLMSLSRECYRHLTSFVKKAVAIAIIRADRINTPEVAEFIISDGDADTVGMGVAAFPRIHGHDVAIVYVPKIWV